MYIRTFEGFASPSVKFNPSFSGKDYMWSDAIKQTFFVARPPFVGGSQVTRKLKVRFSADLPTFRERFKTAIGRLMVFRSDGGKMAEEELESLNPESLHEKLVADKAKTKNFVVLEMRIFYLKRRSGDWILNNFAFPVDLTWEWE